MYLVAVRIDKENKIFSFDNEYNAKNFIKEIKDKVDSYAITEEIQ